MTDVDLLESGIVALAEQAKLAVGEPDDLEQLRRARDATLVFVEGLERRGKPHDIQLAQHNRRWLAEQAEDIARLEGSAPS